MKTFFEKIKYCIRYILFRLGLAILGAVVFGLIYLDKRIELRKEVKDYTPVAQAEMMGDLPMDKAFIAFGKLKQSQMKFISDESVKRGISPLLTFAMIKQESRGDPWAGSNAGAIGTMQVTASTARKLCKRVKGPDDLWKFEENIICGLEILDYCLSKSKGEVMPALYCYNASPSCEEKCKKQDCRRDQYDNEQCTVVCTSPCSQPYDYARRIFTHMNEMKREG